MKTSIVIIAYDVANNKARGRLSGILKEYGVRAQRSVFECEIDARSLTAIQAHVHDLLDPLTDSVRIYHICRQCARRIETRGQGVKLVTLDYFIA